MADEIEQLGIEIGFGLKWKELEDSIDKAMDIVEDKVVESVDEIGGKSGKKLSKGIDKGLKEEKPAMKKSADENIGKPIQGAISKRIKQIVDFAIGGLLTKAMVKVGAVIKGIFSTAARDAISFERGIAEVNSILDKNVTVTDEATKSLLRFSANFGTSQRKQVKAFYNIVSAGIKGANKQLGVLEVSNKAAVAGLVDIDTAAFAIVSSMNAYSNSGLTATEAGNVLFKGVKEGQLVFRDLANSMGKVANFGNQLGLSFDEVVGSLAAVTRTGLSASETASALRQLFSSILGPSEQAKDAISELNEKFEENIDKQIKLGKITEKEGLAKISKSFINFSKQGVEAIGGIGPFLKNLTKQIDPTSNALIVLFKNMRAFTAVASATSNLKQFDDVLASTKDSTGALNDAFAILSNTLDFKLKKAVAIMKVIGTTIFSALIGPAKAAIDVFNNNVGPAVLTALDAILFFSKGIELGFNLMVGFVKEAVAAIRLVASEAELAVFSKIKPVLQILLRLTSRFPKVASKVKTLLAVIGNETEAAKERIKVSLDDIKGAYKDVFDFSFSAAIQSVKDSLEDLLLNQDKFTEEMKQKLKEALAEMKKFAKDAEKEAEGANIGGAFASGLTEGVKVMAQALADGKNALDAFADNFLNIVGNMAIQVGTVMIGVGMTKILLGPDPGPGIVAAGAGLVAIGVILSSFSGGAPSPASSGGGVAVASSPEELEPEERVATTNVNLNVEGSIFDGDNTARRLADLLNAGFDSENITLKQGF